MYHIYFLHIYICIIIQNCFICYCHFFNPTKPYDPQKAISDRARFLEWINTELKQIKENLENNTYDERTTSDRDDMSYFMEVIETIDSIAIARITGSRMPVYRIRIGDNVMIDN